jgi:hypothetical protein
MNRVVSVFLALLVGGGLTCFSQEAVPSDSKPVIIIPKVAPNKPRITGTIREPEPLPFYVYNNEIKPPVKNFAPSGYMGDVSDLKVMGAYTNTMKKDVPSLKIGYMAGGEMGWSGLVWQNPANNWGEFDGGYNLSKAKTISFWAKGEKGDEVVEFRLGGMASMHPDSDSVSAGDITLKTEWTQYTLDLSAANLNYISCGFGFVLKQEANPLGATFYLDDIKYGD